MMETTLKTGPRRAIGILLALVIAFTLAVLLGGTDKAWAEERNDCLTFSSDAPFDFAINGESDNVWDGTVEYSTDGVNWEAYSINTSLSSEIDGNGKYVVYLRGSNNTYISTISINGKFNTIVLTPTSGNLVDCSGNIETLLDYSTVQGDEHPTMHSSGAFKKLFENCTTLHTAPALGSTTLTYGCYYAMFEGCTSLEEAPELPATELAKYCYQNMFSGCTSLKSAPELSVMTLIEGCYDHMFKNCTSLEEAPELPATDLVKYCYYGMFSGCRSLKKAPDLKAHTMAERCYSSMFSECTSITELPKIEAEVTASDCFKAMFRGCTGLTSKLAAALEDDTYTDETKEKIRNAIVQFNKMIDENFFWNSLTPNGFLQAYNSAIEKKAEAEVAMASDVEDEEAAAPVRELILALPDKDDVTLSHEDQITAAREAYEGLTDKEKAHIHADELQKLIDAETGLSELNSVLGDLQELVDEAKGEDNSIYTDESLVLFTQKLAAAETLLGNPANQTKGEVDNAIAALVTAMEGRITKEAASIDEAREELGSLIGNAQDEDSDLLTDESRTTLETAIGVAKGVYDNDDATLDDLNQAISNLNTVMTNLKYLDGYRENAEAELRGYKNHDDYSEAGKAALDGILNEAITNIWTKTSEAEIDAIVVQAKADMDKVKTKVQEKEAAKDALDNGIKDAEDLLKDKDKYTDDTAQALQDAVDAAKEVSNDPNATKEALDNAKKAIDDAVAGLKEKGSENDPNAPIPSEITPQTPATQASVEKMITTAKNDNDLKGSTFAPLKFMSKKQTKKSIKVKWTKVKGAKKYTLYGNLCGKNKPYKKIASVSGSTVNVKKVAGKKLKKGKMYKFVVVAEDGNKAVALSKTIHVNSGGKKKVGNYNKVTVKKKVVKKAKKLKAGKTLALKAKATKKKGKKVKRHVKVRYESSNKTIATVTKAGKVKGLKKGKCVIYAYAQNGIYKKISVRVK